MNLLRIELLKLKSYVPLRVLFGIFIIMLPFGFYGSNQFLGSVEFNNMPQDLLPNFFNLPDLWYHLTYHASWYNMLFGVIAMILITNEISFRTMRQNVIDGMQRSQLITSKLIVISIISVGAGIYVGLVGVCYILGNGQEFAMEALTAKISYLPAYVFQLFTYMCAGLLTGLVIKRAGLGIMLYIFAIPADFFLNTLLSKIISPSLGGLLPFSAISSNVKMHYNPMTIMMPMPEFELGQVFMVSCVWLLVFIGASYLTVKSSDI